MAGTSERRPMKWISPRRPKAPSRLHVGCGIAILPGWCNIDIQALPGVDVVADVTKGLDFKDVEFIFCEHFIEHLQLDDGIRFLHRCCAALRPGGILRLSTPNLDWVYVTHYDLQAEPPKKITNAMMLNRAFHGWGHHFLWNVESLEHVLVGVGFGQAERCEYAHSAHPELQGLERHERCEATPSLPDVIVVEATRGPSGPASSQVLAEILGQAREQYLQFLEWKVER